MGRRRVVDERQLALPFEMEVEAYCEAAKAILENAKPAPTSHTSHTYDEIQFNAGLQEACKEAIKRAGMSRPQMLDRANALFDRRGDPSDEKTRPWTMPMLDNWLSKPGVNIPSRIVFAICAVTNDLGPFEHLVAKLGGTVMSPEARKDWLLGRLDRNIRAQQRLRREILQQLRRSGAAYTDTEDMDHGKEEKQGKKGSGARKRDAKPDNGADEGG